MWSVEGINESSNTITLLSCDNMELWKEEYPIETSILNKIKSRYEQNDRLVIEIDEATQKVVTIGL